MKTILLAASAALLGACAASAPPTSWGKANVSRLEYGTDLGNCTGSAALVSAGNGANTACGISGQNTPAPTSTQGDSAKAAGQASANNTNAVPSGAAFPTGGGGAYRDSVPQDMVARAANQQQAQAMAEKRARAEAFKSCISGRGYQEFTLTAEQQAHLKTLKSGSNEYHEYLYRLGADPANLQSRPRGGTAQ
jgi:hypothetical protein